MSDLTDFLLARIAEDAAVAEAAAEAFARRGHAGTAPTWTSRRQWERIDPPVAEQIRRFNPARALVDVEAKRRIVELHDSTLDMPWCRSCGRADIPNGAHEWPCSTILALAGVYANHPDHRQEWKPDR